MPTNAALNETNDEFLDEVRAEPTDASAVALLRFDPSTLNADAERKLSEIRDELRKEIKPKSYIERMRRRRKSINGRGRQFDSSAFRVASQQ